ncbi:DUF2905 domain-containing protein [Prosthecochloris sp.]|uniref:DUF2905 domain-containing protein n=1 Tax=Prosthecochloris sp. TaxID=290513 RepID=UPI0025FC670A|nr:DUF2905 domain-containing protein [Prosthecochloris sp.]
MFTEIGKLLVVIGIIAVVAGVLLITFQKTGTPVYMRWLGNLPFDIKIVRDNFKFYFPIGTSIVLSFILSFLLYLVNKIFR